MTPNQPRHTGQGHIFIIITSLILLLALMENVRKLNLMLAHISLSASGGIERVGEFLY